VTGRHPSRVLVLGCGSVSQCTLPLLVRDLRLDPTTITVFDMVDNRARIADSIAAGVRYEVGHITQENLHEVLAARVGAGDLVLDLAWNIDACEILQWCHDHGVMYLNTSVEQWDPYEGGAVEAPVGPHAVRAAHGHAAHDVEVVRRPGPRRSWSTAPTPAWSRTSPSRRSPTSAPRCWRAGWRGSARPIEQSLAERRYAALAQALDVKVIHISERDTQIASAPKEVDEFVNTWSVEGFYEEGVAPAELGWGTHERRLPDRAFVHAGHGPGNQICIAQPGMETWVRSYVPLGGEIRGMVIRHGEAFTICDHLTVRDDDGVPRTGPPCTTPTAPRTPPS
jgi:homospermidine synthase